MAIIDPQYYYVCGAKPPLTRRKRRYDLSRKRDRGKATHHIAAYMVIVEDFIGCFTRRTEHFPRSDVAM